MRAKETNASIPTPVIPVVLFIKRALIGKRDFRI